MDKTDRKKYIDTFIFLRIIFLYQDKISKIAEF